MSPVFRPGFGVGTWAMSAYEVHVLKEGFCHDNSDGTWLKVDSPEPEDNNSHLWSQITIAGLMPLRWRQPFQSSRLQLSY